MATLARRVFKTFLFIGLFILSVRYVHTYPQPMTPSQLSVLFSICTKLGIRDPDDLYIPAMMAAEIVTTVLVYRLIIKLWRCCRTKRLNTATRE